jgi:zinc transport system ATP-binding protein
MSVTPAPEPGEVVGADNLTVQLGGLPVLRGIDLRVHRGEAVALMGGNGSGKSTLVRSLIRLLPHQRGEVRLFGTPLNSFEAWARIGYVPQRSATVMRTAKVKEVVASGRLARRKPFLPLGASDRNAISHALAAVGLADRAAAEMTRLSGGQQQRVLIARALVGEPELLVLDEPTAGVDLKSQRGLAELLAELVAGGASLLVVLHEVGPLRPLLDRAIVLHEGRVVSDSPVVPSGDLERAGRHEHDEQRPSSDQTWLGGAVER